MAEHSSSSESLNPDFLPDNNETAESTNEKSESIEDEYANQLNNYQQELINTDSPRVYLEIAEELEKLFEKVLKQFKELPNSFIQSFEDVFNFAKEDKKFKDRTDYKAFNKLLTLVERCNYIEQEINDEEAKREENELEAANNETSAEEATIARPDNIDINRIYKFFNISFVEKVDEAEDEEKPMDEQESQDFANKNALFIYKNAETLMLYSQCPEMRAHSALTYVYSCEHNGVEVVPFLEYAFNEIVQNQMVDEIYEFENELEETFVSRLIEAGIKVSPFSHCNNAVMLGIFALCTEEERVRMALGISRSLEIPFVEEFQELMHCNINMQKSVAELDFKYYNHQFEDLYEQVSNLNELQLIESIVNILPTTETYIKNNQETLLYIVQCYCKFGTFDEIVQFSHRFELIEPQIKHTFEYNDSTTKNTKKVSRKFMKKDAYYTKDYVTVDYEDEITEKYTELDKLYYKTELLIAVKLAELLELDESVTYLSNIDDDFEEKLSGSDVLILRDILSMRAAQIEIYGVQMNEFERKNIEVMLEELESGESTSHILLLKGLLLGDEELIKNVNSELLEATRILMARNWMLRYKNSIEVNKKAITELFGLKEEDLE